MLPIDYSGQLARFGIKHVALYEAIREAIADGTLAPGERLPSTRTFAAEYGLSRGSVSLAYDMLASGGYLRAGIGQGTFVAGSPGTKRPDNNRCEDGDRAAPAAPRLSSWGKRIAAMYEEERLTERGANEAGSADIRVSFVPQGIGSRWFPWAEWRAVTAARWKKLGASGEDGSSDPAGSMGLRRSIADRLRRERGITCDPGDIVLTSGSMQAIALVSQILLEEGTNAVVENPGYSGIRRAVRMSGARCVEGNVDECGIVPEDWDADLLFVTRRGSFRRAPS
ncbi:aminotransferase class I/II-fold pyridoxal phosphate-dependent enzyme [Cohnella faecalis]|uniref:PLP-dependent aminotransferase family protein n=1 Tax=Cohnella faecalis TaxID=2315694 RepID=A0A398CPY7_9BACL|nr:PLP-dependent aminotransferase family protein [Cohnella faecalis]RIE04595.1 PLP-dependent aminotransferase family protein [Cohnella faecalis]